MGLAKSCDQTDRANLYEIVVCIDGIWNFVTFVFHDAVPWDSLGHSQHGCIQNGTESGANFQIKKGVGQRCVLNPRLFVSGLEWAMQKRQGKFEHEGAGIGLGDGFRPLLGLTFADDVLLSARTASERVFFVDMLVDELAEAGPILPPQN